MGHSLQLDSVVYQGGWGRDAAAALLLDNDCPADALDNNGCSALHYAAGELLQLHAQLLLQGLHVHQVLGRRGQRHT